MRIEREEMTKEQQLARSKQKIERALVGCKNVLLSTIQNAEKIIYDNNFGLTPEEVFGAFGEQASELGLIKEKVLELVAMVDVADGD